MDDARRTQRRRPGRRALLVIAVTAVALLVLAALAVTFWVRVPDDGRILVDDIDLSLAAGSPASAGTSGAATGTAADEPDQAGRRCHRARKVCAVLNHARRMAVVAHRRGHGSHAERFPVPDYGNHERRVIRKHNLKLIGRHYFAHPRRHLPGHRVAIESLPGETRQWINRHGQPCASWTHQPPRLESLVGVDMWEFETEFEWCWRGSQITHHSGDLDTTYVNDFAIDLNGLIENDDHFTDGLHRIFQFDRLYKATNCVFKYGCMRWLYPRYEINVSANAHIDGYFWWA